MPGTPTAGVINGTDLLVYIDASHPIGYSTTCTIALNADMRDTSNKDSAGWKKVVPGQKNWTISCEALASYASTYNLKYLMDLILNKTAVSIKVSTANPSGDAVFSGTAYVTSCNVTAANEANGTLSVQFQGDGALSLATT